MMPVYQYFFCVSDSSLSLSLSLSRTHSLLLHVCMRPPYISSAYSLSHGDRTGSHSHHQSPTVIESSTQTHTHVSISMYVYVCTHKLYLARSMSLLRISMPELPIFTLTPRKHFPSIHHHNRVRTSARHGRDFHFPFTQLLPPPLFLSLSLSLSHTHTLTHSLFLSLSRDLS